MHGPQGTFKRNSANRTPSAKPSMRSRQIRHRRVGRRARENVKKAGADKDADIMAAAKKLLEQLEAQPGGTSIVQTATGNYNAQAADHSTASVNVNVPKEDRPK